jgi:hypothetical protein
LVFAVSRSIQINPIIRMKIKRKNFTVPRILFSIMPDFREMAWSKHANVFAASAIAMILPGVCSTKQASRTLCAKDTEFGAVFSRTIKVIPNKHVARKTGFFKR